jgi:transposase-like protein
MSSIESALSNILFTNIESGVVPIDRQGSIPSKQSTGAESYLNTLKNRGIEDILILCSDGLKGLKEAIQTAFLRTEHHHWK